MQHYTLTRREYKGKILLEKIHAGPGSEKNNSGYTTRPRTERHIIEKSKDLPCCTVPLHAEFQWTLSSRGFCGKCLYYVRELPHGDLSIFPIQT
jgi:hypothetical protein